MSKRKLEWYFFSEKNFSGWYGEVYYAVFLRCGGSNVVLKNPFPSVRSIFARHWVTVQTKDLLKVPIIVLFLIWCKKCSIKQFFNSIRCNVFSLKTFLAALVDTIMLKLPLLIWCIVKKEKKVMVRQKKADAHIDLLSQTGMISTLGIKI